MARKLPGLSTWIFIGLVLGIIGGAVAHELIWADFDTSTLKPEMVDRLKAFAGKEVIGYKLLSDIFISLVKVIVAPLVFSLLLVGLVKTGNFSAMGRIGIKTMVYFTFATLIALTMGLIIVNIFQPGAALDVSSATEKVVEAKPFDLANFVLHIFPKNIIDAMAHNEILPIIVFTLFFAAACSAIGEKAKIVVDFFDAVAHVMLKVTSYVMYFAPLAVLGAVAAVIAVHGLGILAGYLKVILCFFGGLALFVFGVLPLICYAMRIEYFRLLKVTSYVMYFAPLAVLGAVAAVIAVHGLGILAGYLKVILCFFGGLALFVFGVLPLICYAMRIEYFRLLKLIREPMLLAFGTSSSEAAMPKTINALERFGCPDRIIGFVLPLGYSFNLDGSIMYMTFATVSIAQAYGIDLSITQQITMMLMLLVTSKGMAGVPRASLVVIAGMLDAFGIPAEGLSIIVAVDWLLDMGRSATNVAGNAVATAVVSKWEKVLEQPGKV